MVNTRAASTAGIRKNSKALTSALAQSPKSSRLSTIEALRVVLVVIAAVCVVMFLHYAKDLLVPVVAALVIAACLEPIDHFLRRFIPWDSVAAAATILAALAVIGGAAYFVSDDLTQALERLPEVSKQLRDRVNLEPATSNPVKKIAEAAQNLEAVATTMSEPTGPNKSAPPAPKAAEAQPPRASWVRTQLMLGSTTLLQGVTQLALAFLIAFFILASGPMLRRKLLRASGNHRHQRARFRRILLQSTQQVKYYVVIVVVTNVAIGLAAWPAFYLLGFDHPGLWALFAGVVHVVPYIGSIALATSASIFHYVATPDIWKSVYVGMVILVVASLVGTLLPTWLQSKTSRMNQVAIFAGVMFWGWMWGLWGLFLGAPIVVIAKVVCDNVSSLRGTARLLGD